MQWVSMDCVDGKDEDRGSKGWRERPRTLSLLFLHMNIGEVTYVYETMMRAVLL
jgi:hypothetical protein